MRRTLDQALLDLRHQIGVWALGAKRAGIYLFPYAPEWEAAMLARLPKFAADCEESGWAVLLVDVGQGFLAEIERRKGLPDRLAALERNAPNRLLQDLGTLAQRYLTDLLCSPVEPRFVARLLVNTGTLATFASYSAISNNLDFDGTWGQIGAANVIAFPGDDDGRLISLLRLRTDSSYRLPRI